MLRIFLLMILYITYTRKVQGVAELEVHGEKSEPNYKLQLLLLLLLLLA